MTTRTDGLRLSDSEREDAVRALGDHYAQGRLTLEEHSERTERVYAARTRGELPALFADLPGGAPVSLGSAYASTPTQRRATTPGRPRSRRPPFLRFGLVQVVLLVLLLAFVAQFLPLILVGLITWVVLGSLRAGRCGRRP